MCRRRESSGSEGLDDGDVERLTPDETARVLAGDPDALLKTETRVTLDAKLAGDTERTRSAAVAPVMARLRDAGVVTGWRDELFSGELEVRRAPRVAGRARDGVAARHTRVRRARQRLRVSGHAQTVHADAPVGRAGAARPNRRFRTRWTISWRGACPRTWTRCACAIKECEEEASVPVTLSSSNLVSAGCVTYNSDYLGCCKRDVLFCYDLRLPGDFVPKPNDGEVESFALVPVDEACRLVAETKEFKPNVALVLVDFFVRHGIVTPEEPGYVELVEGAEAVNDDGSRAQRAPGFFNV